MKKIAYGLILLALACALPAAACPNGTLNYYGSCYTSCPNGTVNYYGFCYPPPSGQSCCLPGTDTGYSCQIDPACATAPSPGGPGGITSWPMCGLRPCQQLGDATSASEPRVISQKEASLLPKASTREQQCLISMDADRPGSPSTSITANSVLQWQPCRVPDEVAAEFGGGVNSVGSLEPKIPDLPPYPDAYGGLTHMGNWATDYLGCLTFHPLWYTDWGSFSGGSCQAMINGEMRYGYRQCTDAWSGFTTYWGSCRQYCSYTCFYG